MYKRSEYTRVLNMPQVLNIPGFSICHGSEYARVLNIPVFLICLWYEYAIVMTFPGFWLYQVLNTVGF